MKIRSFAPVAALALALALTPVVAAHADEYPLVTGNYVEVDGISIDDGHDLEYAKHLAGIWRKGKDFAVKQGWIVGYQILENEEPRAGEPDLYLVTTFARMADTAEAEKRHQAYGEYMKATIATMQAESGERAKYRHKVSSMMLRELTFRN